MVVVVILNHVQHLAKRDARYEDIADPVVDETTRSRDHSSGVIPGLKTLNEDLPASEQGQDLFTSCFGQAVDVKNPVGLRQLLVDVRLRQLNVT